MATKIQCWWRDPSLVLYNKYYEADEEVSQYMRENCQFLGIFFGAFRNKSTKHFITYLNKFYRYIQQRDEPFDIIYVPLDEDEPECDYFVNACMEEWLVVPWTNQNLRRNVRNLYNVLTQPTLVVVRNDDEGTVVSYDGKTDLLECGYFALIEWKSVYKKILQDIKEGKKVKEKVKTPPENPPDIHPDNSTDNSTEKPTDSSLEKPPGDSSQKLPDNPTEKLPENPSQKLADNSSQKLADNSSQNLPDNSSQNLPDNSSQNLPDKSSQRLPDDSTETNVSEKPSKSSPEKLADDSSEKNPDKPAEE